VALAVELPAWVFLAFFLATIIIYAPAFWTRVPYYPTSKPTYALILAELPTDRPFTFVDIGCGFGDLVLFLARHRPHGVFTGIEIGVLPFCVAYCRSLLRGGGRTHVLFRSMWNLNFAEYDTVYTFLSPAPMERIWQKARHEMKPSSLFITNSFAVPATPSRTVQDKDDRKSVLYFHDMAQTDPM
jgi:SAM-dependent methyltransferase